MNYICLLSVRPLVKTYDFFKKLASTNPDYKIVIVIDDNSYNIPNYDGDIEIIKIDNGIVEKAGYKNSLYYQWSPGSIKKWHNCAGSRDKALYYFNTQNINFKYVWFIEEDVFIPTLNTIKNIDTAYPEGDLLCASNKIYNNRQHGWHWNFVYSTCGLSPPYGRSMICSIRCSKLMLDSIHEYVIKNGTLFVDESLFNTIALHSKLTINSIPELKNIVWRHNWTLNDISKNNMYHPIKDINKQYTFREYINK